MEPGPTTSPRLLDQVHAAIRVRHLSPATDAVYTKWIRSFILPDVNYKCVPATVASEPMR